MKQCLRQNARTETGGYLRRRLRCPPGIKYVVMFFVFVCLPAAAFAQEGMSGIIGELDELERIRHIRANPSAAIVQRLSILEQNLFGSQRPGSMIERLEALKAAIKPPSFQRQNNPPSSGAAEAIAQPPSGHQNDSSQAHSQAGISAGPGWMPLPGQNNIPDKTGAEVGLPPAPQIAPPANNVTPVSGWQPGYQPARDRHLQKKEVLPSAAPPAQNPVPGTVSATQFNRMIAAPLPLPGALRLHKNFAPDVLPLLNGFPPHLVRMEATGAALPVGSDYFSVVQKESKGKTIRYKYMPIPVYIQPFADSTFVNCVIRAFEAWEMRTDGAVKFSQIDNPNQARIQVVWKRLGKDKDTQGCLLGAHTILKYTNHGNGNLSFMTVGAIPVPLYIPRLGPKYTVPPQVIEVNLDLIMNKEQAVRYACLQNIVTHELGHALGMLGHSADQADVMYPVTDEHSRLSERDINTLIKLYHSKCDIPL